jgi:hypothetical protein
MPPIRSPRFYARIAGALYLVNIIFGFYAIGYVSSMLIGEDPATTARNIITHEGLYRSGLVAHIIILLTNFPLAVIFFYLFQPVSRKAAWLVVFVSLAGTSVEAVNLLNQYAPLLLLKGGPNLASFSQEQLNSLSFMFLKLGNTGFNLALVFFGCYGITVGWLITKSGFLPRTIGILMILGGCCYLFYSFSVFLSPRFASSLVPYIQIPSGLAELSFCLWLLIAGINANKWKYK